MRDCMFVHIYACILSLSIFLLSIYLSLYIYFMGLPPAIVRLEIPKSIGRPTDWKHRQESVLLC